MHRTYLIVVSLLLCSTAHAADPDPRITARDGWVIFDPTKDGFAYRYGPSIIVNPDGKIDAWFASPGGKGVDNSDQWDWIRHRSSTDGGHTWSAEKVVLKPTPGSRDQQSDCDPGVIRINDWYYLGFTAVEDPKGMCNEVFIARSHSPTGPFDKWDGSKWGGSPQPILPFRKPTDVWGLGEPSFVLLDKTLFIYYTQNTRDQHGHKLERTRVATAPGDADDWPAHITQKRIAFERVKGEDSADVKYDEISKRFLAVTTADRMSPEAHVNARWSSDGFTFGEPTKVEGPVMTRCHNIGIAVRLEGICCPMATTLSPMPTATEPARIPVGRFGTRI
jgi:predicted GH43/DUF377 family glycosyl hydrolase